VRANLTVRAGSLHPDGRLSCTRPPVRRKKEKGEKEKEDHVHLFFLLPFSFIPCAIRRPAAIGLLVGQIKGPSFAALDAAPSPRVAPADPG
jgi:hypothetical protein